jgi:uncharacterized membrane protein YebE (DUF533 family)
MRRSEAERLLGALLGGGTGVRPVRRRRAAPRQLAGIPGGASLARAAIGAFGAIAVEVIRGMNDRAGQVAEPPPAPAPARRMPQVARAPMPALPEPDQDSEAAEALLLVRAMIAAARADGVIDADERAAIAARLDAADLDAAARDLVLAEFTNPITLSALAASVPDPVAAAQVYAASVIAVGEMNAAERAYLDKLAAALRLSPAAAKSIEERLAP